MIFAVPTVSLLDRFQSATRSSRSVRRLLPSESKSSVDSVQLLEDSTEKLRMRLFLVCMEKAM